MQNEKVGIERLEDELQYYADLVAEERATIAELQQLRVAAGDSGGYDDADRQERAVSANRKLWRAVGGRRRTRPLGRVPQVDEVQNKITAAWREVAEVEEEVRTLLKVRRWRNRGLAEVREGDSSVSELRKKQHDEERHLRERMKELEKELKAVEKRDVALHERFSQLQKQLLLHVTEKEAAELKDRYDQQMRLIDDLQRQRKEQAAARGELVSEGHQLTMKAEKARLELEREIAELKALVLERDEELTQLYRSIGGRRTQNP